MVDSGLIDAVDTKLVVLVDVTVGTTVELDDVNGLVVARSTVEELAMFDVDGAVLTSPAASVVDTSLVVFGKEDTIVV